MESLICTFIHDDTSNNDLCVPRIIKTIHLRWNVLPLMEYFLVRRHDMWWLQIMVSNNSNFGHFTFLSDYLMRCLFTVLSFRFRLCIENVNVIRYLKHKADHFIRKHLWSVHTLSNHYIKLIFSSMTKRCFGFVTEYFLEGVLIKN